MAIKEKYTDWTEFLIQELTGSRTAPANLLEGPLRGKNTVDLIMLGSLIELQDSQNPFQYWIVRVIENIGGRLRLRYFGLDCDTHDKWLFYLDFRLRPVGWCLENRYSMEPPTEIQGLRAATDWKDALERAITEAAKNPLPLEVFKVYNDHYFHVTIDNLAGDPTPSSLLCHAESPGILPVEWCLKNGVNLTRPKGLKKPFAEYIVDVESMDIFPVGWCEANGYHLTPPNRVICQTQKKIAVVQPEKQLLTSVPVENVSHNICPNAPLDTAYYYGKKKKVIKPTIGDSCVESSLTKPARRRKKRKSIFVQKKRRSSAVDYTPAASPQDSEEDEDQDGPEDDTGSEETSSEQREDQTDTSSVEVLTTRPRRAAALRRNTDTPRPTSIERSRRKRTTRSLSYTEDIKYHPAKRSAAKDIDGQALLLLTLPTVQECMELKLGPAIKLCHQIERVKVAFYAQYAN
ncbi:hypothetical protein EOD39_3986 [Acipenser ruthenus]|uniref:Scm-like with four MBT domains protein 2 n=1 Tax=Acipenser ruthenus TaxID=7906 RepID=A0A444UKC7_ACIRT|nr:hypothetical protein EOD39_3986 [Acipenser ruthenus]